ncbi:glycoside hydrolase family 13 protein [Alistipes sp.]|uniref:glycoside hydrolase family 13 protein n=1 Tax=Alistipes sp. TaxID=1872444 RepID=UPI003AEF38AD
MKIRHSLILFVAMAALSCNTSAFDPASVPDADGQVARVEPLSWWTGMQTPLQLMLYGENISACEVTIEGGGARITALHRADSPNYLFADVEIDPAAEPGTRYLVFTREGEQFKVPYEIAARREGSRERESFTTADAIYLLMPDRFADGDPSIDSTPDTHEKAARDEFFGRHGGDLQGMIDHLDYIASLGMTAVWSTPLLLDDEPQGSYHGYACADYYHIDPRFGTNELYREFVAEGHRRGLKTVMDIVTNHCGIAHWWMRDLPFENWVHRFEEDRYVQTNNLFSTNMDPNASQYDLRIQESGWFDRSMPDMNLDNEFLLRYFQQWAVWWIEYADLDGLRVDTYPYNEKEPMSRWCAAVRAEYPNMNIVGECWTADVPQLAYWQGGNPNRDGFDSHLPSIMDFPLRDAICAALPTDSLRWGEGMIRVYNALSDDFVYHDLSKMLIFTANHDTERIGDVVRGNVGRAKIAMTLIATLRGIPQMFAGDELLFRSKDLSQGHGGLRVDFPGGWPGDEVDLFDPAQHTGDAAEVYDHTRRLFTWRKEKPVIHHGRTLHFAGRDNTYAYFRYDDTDAVFVFINNSRGRKNVPWSHYAEITPTLAAGRNVLTGEAIAVSDTTTVGPRESLVVEFSRSVR